MISVVSGSRVVLWVIAFSGVLNFLGFIVDRVWLEQRWHEIPGYFDYKIAAMADFPYWFLATLMLVALNGITIAKNSKVNWNLSDWNFRIDLPEVRIIGQNILFVVVLIGLYVFLNSFVSR